jgi:hypothetical protein
MHDSRASYKRVNFLCITARAFVATKYFSFSSPRSYAPS